MNNTMKHIYHLCACFMFVVLMILAGCTRAVPSSGVIDVASASGHIVTIQPEYEPTLSGDF